MNWEKDINSLAQQIKEWRESKYFYTPSDIDTEEHADQMLGKLMLVVSEVAEAAEAVRHGDIANFQEEIADTVIRLLDISASFGMDIHRVVSDKMDVNFTRPTKHGKSGTSL